MKKIRKATQGDIDKLIELMIIANSRKRKWAEERVRRYIDNKKKFILVAEENKKLVGFVGIKKIEEKNKASRFINLNKCATLTWIAILPKYRRRGIGSKLLIACDKYAKNFNKKFIWLDCREKVLPFYLKNSYQVEGNYIDKHENRYVLVKELK